MTTMEDLTKTQIVLLTLLVSFITSIATGIITVSLLAQAPQGVTQTIDRVVERTVEKVVPAQGGATTREVTVIKEGDAIVSSIESSNKSIVRIKSPNDATGAKPFYALGVIVNKQGYVVSDKREVMNGNTYTVVLHDGTELPATISKVVDGVNLVMFKIQAEDSKLRALSSLTISKDNPKLGQTVVAVQGTEKTVIAVGRVLSLDSVSNSSMTDIVPSTEIQGSPLLNLSGELVGLKTSNSDLSITPSVYTNALSLSKFVSGN